MYHHVSTELKQEENVKTAEMVLEMPRVITEPAARKQAADHFISYVHSGATQEGEKLRPFFNNLNYEIDEVGNLRLEGSLTGDLSICPLSVLSSWTEEVWQKSLESLVGSNSMIKCEIK